MPAKNLPLLTSLLAALLWALAGASPAAATLSGERTDNTKTGWYWYYNVDFNTLNQLIETEGARLVDIEVNPSSQAGGAQTYSAAFVANTGVHAKTWWWYVGIDAATISQNLQQNNARLIDIERWPDEGSNLFAVIMVRNAGATAKTWWWYYNVDETFLSERIDRDNGRLIDIEPRLVEGQWRFDAILIENAGDDALAWYWYYNVDKATIDANIAQNSTRIYELEVPNPTTPRFHAILIQNYGVVATKWWWYYGQSGASLGEKIDQNGARLTDIQPYDDGSGGTRYAGVMITNLNDLELEIACELGFGEDGSTGFRLEEVDGPVLASLQPDFVFEPASTIKAAHLLHTMRVVQAGSDNLNNIVAHDTGLTGSCPDGSGPVINETLRSVAVKMMVNSSNTATETIRARYGTGAINATMDAAGMLASDLNHEPLGCGLPAINNPNELTLREICGMYERVANGSILSPANRDEYFDIMWSEEESGWFQTDLKDIIDFEAAALGDPQLGADFWDNVDLAFKAGSYTLNFGGGTHEYRSVAGWVELPTCETSRTGVPLTRQYAFGLFVHDAANAADAGAKLGLAAEMFRPLIQETLLYCSRVDVASVPTPRPPAQLLPNVPNPFNPATTLHFELAAAGPTRLSVVDLRGRELVVLHEGPMDAGAHQLRWDGRDAGGRSVASGVYLVRLEASGSRDLRKIVLAK